MALRFNTIMRALIASGESVPSFYFNFSNPSNVTLGAAQARGTITSTQNANITASVSPSRTTGVAPLYVNFDATATTSTLSTNPSHELFYATDFGDYSAGVWANGVQSSGLTSKNAGYGPVTGHVYETPGTYTVQMVVTDGVNTATKTGTIVVQDPNTVYAGTDTICISHSGNFTGAPSGAQQVNTAGNTDMYAAWNTYKASNKRILFCKADSWTSSATITFSGLTGTMLNGYGTGPAHTFASGSLVPLTPNTIPGDGYVFAVAGSTDCHLGNMKVTANATHTTVGGAGGDSTAFTLYKFESRGATCSVSVDGNSTPGSLYKRDQHCIYECLHDDPYGYKGAPADTHRVAAAVGAVGTPGVFTATAHPFQEFHTVQLFGTPPTGLSTGVNYYIASTNLTANTFSLNAVRGGESPLAITVGSTCEVRAMSLSGGQGMFLSLTRGGFMGNYLDNRNRGEQTLRTQYLNTAHLSNNYIARPNQTKNIFKIHCRDYDDISALPGVSGYSEKIIVSANVMDLRGGYSYDGTTTTFTGSPTLIIGNGGASVSGQRVRNGIVENNITYSSLGSPKDLTGFIECNCPNMTVRNNIADMSMGDRTTAYSGTYGFSSVYFATITTSTPDQTIGVRIYNNTLYTNCSSLSHAAFVLITAATVPNPEVDVVTIKNNHWYTPHYPGANHMALRNTAGTSPTLSISNNTDTVAGRSVSSSAADNFTVHPPVALADWRPRSGSYAIDSGTVVPVFKDFNMAARTGTYDMGAVLP